MAHSSLVENFERRLITMMFRLMWAALLLLIVILLPGAIPIYCGITFLQGMLYAWLGVVPAKDKATKLQRYSCFGLGAKAFNWICRR